MSGFLRSNILLKLLILGLGSLSSIHGLAETIVTHRISSLNRLRPLKKITVGPYDQYHGIGTPSGTEVIFTRKSDLVPHLCSQNLATGEVSDLLPLTADSQEPAVSPTEKIAFTYYRHNASGDICYQDLKDAQAGKGAIRCLKTMKGEPSSPFWKNRKELGYLLKDTWKENNSIIVENIDTGTKYTLAEGKIWSPAISPDEKYLFYNELITEGGELKRVLVMKNLQTQATQIVRLSLPGISGFPAVSNDGKYLFFSHYPNDTNNDNVIDAKDNSVVFRIPIEKILQMDNLFPEQLTSVESNCGFPRPHGDFLYVTCAFDGVLNVYKIPTTGIVPVEWTQTLLENAHQTSRSYSDRILILNTLKYRFPLLSQKILEERILSNHIFENNFEAAKFSIDLLSRNTDPQTSDFYTLLKLYLEAKRQKKIHNSDEITPSFQKGILAIERKIDHVKTHLRLKKLLRGLIFTFLNDPQKSFNFLKQINFPDSSPPSKEKFTFQTELYLFFELASWTLPKVEKMSLNPDALIPTFHQMMSASELSEESRIYYTFQFLRYLETQNHTVAERLSRIEQINRRFSDSVTSLLKAEAASLKLIESPDELGKTKKYQELDQLMSASRESYYLRKALYVRCILNFAQAAEFKYLNFVATNWLRYTQNKDTEFAYAREVYSNATLDQAYDNGSKKNYGLASDYFYGSLSLTDDLESHQGYILSMIAQNQRRIIDERYKNLKQRQFIEDNMKFVEAFLILVDAPPSKKGEVKYLDLALEKLSAMTQDKDSAIRYLLMGYCFMEKLIRLGKGFEIDSKLFENSHRSLMLAYEQGHDDVRIVASSLMNLGLLHQRAQNHGLAVNFFMKRKTLGFISDEELAQFTWFYGKSLFFNYQPDLASIQFGNVLGLEPNSKAALLPTHFKTPFLERRAFYLLASEQFKKAALAYEHLFKVGDLNSDIHLAKSYLSYGYSLFKSDRKAEARKALLQSLEHTDHLQPLSKGTDRWVDFRPERIQLVAYGLLAQIGSIPERLDALKHRGILLLKARDLLQEWFPSLIKNELQMAALNEETDVTQAKFHMKEALQFAQKFGNSSQYLANAIFRATSGYLAHALLHPQIYEQEEATQIQKVIEKCLHAYSLLPPPQPLLDYQALMLQTLGKAYSIQRAHGNNFKEVQEILKSPLSLKVKEVFPQQWKTLNDWVFPLNNSNLSDRNIYKKSSNL